MPGAKKQITTIKESDKFNVSLEDFNKENILKLSHGKKNHVIIKIN